MDGQRWRAKDGDPSIKATVSVRLNIDFSDWIICIFDVGGVFVCRQLIQGWLSWW